MNNKINYPLVYLCRLMKRETRMNKNKQNLYINTSLPLY